MTDATKWVTVKVPEGDHETADGYKPDGATWGDCLVAGAERLNENLDSDTSRFQADAEIHVSVPDEDLDTIREDIQDAIADATGGETVPARVVDMDATEREKLAREVAGVLQG